MSEMTVSQLINRLMAAEQEFGDLPVRVEVWNAPSPESDVEIMSVMEDPLIEYEEDGVLYDSYGKPIPDGATSIVITLVEQFDKVDPTGMLEECRGFIAEILEDGIADADWNALQDLYSRLVEMEHNNDDDSD